MYKNYFKRFLDFTVAMILLLLIWPFLLIVTIGLHFANKGAGAFFIQERPGKDEKIFKIFKFKTMTDERNAQGNLLPDELRLTKFGKFLRKTSLDEFPEFINILKGDMSFVGPRPLLVEYLELYNEEQKHRHDVRPGLTGYAQANGRNLLSWEERFQLDLYYVNNVSLLLDIKITSY